MIRELVIKALAAPGRQWWRRALAGTMSVAYSARRRRRQVFSVDDRGYWVNTTDTAAIVSPRIHTADPDAVRRVILDEWCHAYAPGPGDVVVDVGAGIGEEAVVFAQLVGPSGLVIAIEAHPRTAECLERSVARSGLANVTVIPRALADRRGTISISDSEEHLQNSVFGTPSSRGPSVDIPTSTLDDLAAELGLDRIDFLKMNIEGAERLAVTGMAKSISLVRNACISCHDFVADTTGDDGMRTRSLIESFFDGHGFDRLPRREDPRPWVRDYVYVSRRTR